MLLSNQKLVELSLSLEMEIAEVDSFRVFLSGFNALVLFLDKTVTVVYCF